PTWYKKRYQSKRLELIRYSTNWIKNNRVRHRIISRVAQANARAKKYGIEGRLSTLELIEKFRRLGGKCFYCKTNDGVVLDHKTAMSKGGKNILRNVVPACTACNTKKGVLSATAFKRLTSA